MGAVNPLTYRVDALRGSTVVGSEVVHRLGVEYGVMRGVFVVFTTIAAKRYPQLARQPQHASEATRHSSRTPPAPVAPRDI